MSHPQSGENSWSPSFKLHDNHIYTFEVDILVFPLASQHYLNPISRITQHFRDEKSPTDHLL